MLRHSLKNAKFIGILLGVFFVPMQTPQLRYEIDEFSSGRPETVSLLFCTRARDIIAELFNISSMLRVLV